MAFGGQTAGFQNPIIGDQGTLVRQQIQSPDFSQSAETGWAILKNGSAYFYNITASGDITASEFEGTDFVINASGMFLYSGTPALGNLIASYVPAGVTSDGLGNVVIPESISFYTGTQVASLGISAGVNVLTMLTGVAFEGAGFTLAGGPVGSGAAAYLGTGINGPATNVAGHADNVQIALNSANQGGTSSANGEILYKDNGGTYHELAHWDTNGFNIDQGNLITLFNQAADAGSNANGPVLYGLSGHSKYKGSDNQDYDTGRKTLALASTTVINSTNFTQLFTYNVIPGVSYRVHGKIECLQGAAGVAQNIGIFGPATGPPTRIIYMYIKDGAAQTPSVYSNVGTLANIASPAYAAAATFYLEFDGIVTPTASGALALSVAEGTAGDSFSVVSGSFMDVMPVTA